MNEKTGSRSFWIVGIVALLWNAMGSLNFFMQRNPDILASYRESERLLVEGRPAWATIGFALAVFGGTLGCILLLLRKSVSYNFFVASLLGVIVTMIHVLGSGIGFTVGEIAGILFMPFAVAVFLVWYARFAAKKGWTTG